MRRDSSFARLHRDFEQIYKFSGFQQLSMNVVELEKHDFQL